ncbi:MAG: phage portal protein [Planctomycetota bacterium]|nr:phage portal protein [Planctomycetota bacterium]
MQIAGDKTKSAVRLSGLYGSRFRRFPARAVLPFRRLPVGHAGLRAGFDSAETNENNRRHWARADSLSADAAATAEVRRTLRNRARYEVANNSYARGIVLTLANDTVGTGPRLQMLTDDADLNRTVETEFHQWAQAVGLAEKLRTMRMARAQDGEAFAILASNPRVGHTVKLDLQLIEADQVTSPVRHILDDHEVDGIVLDDYGNPILYRVMMNHPGGPMRYSLDDFKTISAESMIHIFRQDRPGQHRGIPEITPALPLFAQLRRFTLAVLAAAEAAADFAGILYTDAPPNGEAEAVEPMDLIELERNMLLTMPGGWKMAQVEPMQPATTYAEFKKEILNEIARCLNMPFNIAAGNSSGYNYASGRLDHQTYFKSIRVDQAFMASRILDRVLAAWLREYAVESDFRTLRVALPAHQWFWDGFEHVDPSKEARAQEMRLKNHTTTLAHEYARQGKDWEVELRQRAKEVALMKELGLPVDEAKPWTGLEPEETSTDEEDGDAVSE